MLRCHNLMVDLRILMRILGRAPYPEGNGKLIAGKVIGNTSRMVTTNDVASRLIAFLAMVGHIHHDGVLVFKPPAYLINNTVIIKHGIIVEGKFLLSWELEVRPQLVVVFRFKLVSVFRTALIIVHVLPDEMENIQIGR